MKRPIAPTVDYSFEHPIYEDDDIIAYHYPYKNHVCIYLDQIKNLPDLYNVYRHEAFHEAMRSEDLDAEIEHRIIDAIDWFDDDIYTPTN